MKEKINGKSSLWPNALSISDLLINRSTKTTLLTIKEIRIIKVKFVKYLF